MGNEVIGVLTRPYEESSIFSEALEECGIWSFIEPMMEIEPVLAGREKILKTKADEYDGIIITSRHALDVLSENDKLKSKPVFAVGEETSKLAEELGFSVELTRQDVAQLAAALKMRYGESKLLYPCGKNITYDLTPDFSNMTKVEVYEAVSAISLSPEFVKGLNNNFFTFLVFFSSRTAQIFEELVEVEGLTYKLKRLDCFAFSEKIAKNVSSDKFRSVEFSEFPNKNEMLKIIMKKFRPVTN